MCGGCNVDEMVGIIVFTLEQLFIFFRGIDEEAAVCEMKRMGGFFSVNLLSLYYRMSGFG